MSGALALRPEEPPAPPANVEAEAALLGALMIENRLIDRFADKLIPEHFFEAIHGQIYSAILRENSLGRAANPVTLRPYFADDPALKEIGGAGYLAKLTGSGASLIAAKDFADQIIELARRRALLARLQAIAIDDWERPYPELVAEAEAAIADAGREASDGLLELSAAECADRAMKAGEDRHQRGIISGIEPIDQALGPIRRKQLIIMAGRPGMGKSATASSYAIGAAKVGLELHEQGEIDQPIGVLYFSLEMSADEIGARMVSDATYRGDGQAVPYYLIENGIAGRDQIRRVMAARDELERLPLQIIDIGQSTTGRLNSLIRRWKRRMAAQDISLELVIVDYLQKLRPDFKARDLYEKITEVSQDLKSIAKVNDVGILALAQLSRAVEQRPDHRPQLSDLRDSGQIEQDADGVLFLYRQEYYLEQTKPDQDDPGQARWEEAFAACENKIEFICAKRRMGRTGKRIGHFYGAFSAVRA